MISIFENESRADLTPKSCPFFLNLIVEIEES